MLHQLESRIEENVRHWVKAVVDSSLGQLGTMGALAVEEFMVRLNLAFVEVLASQTVLTSDSSRD